MTAAAAALCQCRSAMSQCPDSVGLVLSVPHAFESGQLLTAKAGMRTVPAKLLLVITASSGAALTSFCSSLGRKGLVPALHQAYGARAVGCVHNCPLKGPGGAAGWGQGSPGENGAQQAKRG